MWQEYTAALVRPLLQFLEATHPTRAGQPRLGTLKFNLAVSAIHNLIMLGAVKGNLEVADVSNVAVAEVVQNTVNEMQQEGQLGGRKDKAIAEKQAAPTTTGRVPIAHFPQKSGVDATDLTGALRAEQNKDPNKVEWMPTSEYERKVAQSKIDQLDPLIELGNRIGAAQTPSSAASADRVRDLARRVLQK